MADKENEFKKLVEKIADKNDETLKKLAEVESNERLEALKRFAARGKEENIFKKAYRENINMRVEEENKRDQDIAKKWEKELAEDSEVFQSKKALFQDLNDEIDNKKNGHE